MPELKHDVFRERATLRPGMAVDKKGALAFFEQWFAAIPGLSASVGRRGARPLDRLHALGCEPVRRVRVLVSGDVQGVGFRWFCREQAMGHGVSGSVRNLPDGRVEACFEGDGDAVDAMVEWCREGPRGARVTGIEFQDQTPLGGEGFVIAR